MHCNYKLLVKCNNKHFELFKRRPFDQSLFKLLMFTLRLPWPSSSPNVMTTVAGSRSRSPKTYFRRPGTSLEYNMGTWMLVTWPPFFTVISTISTVKNSSSSNFFLAMASLMPGWTDFLPLTVLMAAPMALQVSSGKFFWTLSFIMSSWVKGFSGVFLPNSTWRVLDPLGRSSWSPFFPTSEVRNSLRILAATCPLLCGDSSRTPATTLLFLEVLLQQWGFPLPYSP